MTPPYSLPFAVLLNANSSGFDRGKRTRLRIQGRSEATIQIFKLCTCPLDLLNPHSAIYCNKIKSGIGDELISLVCRRFTYHECESLTMRVAHEVCTQSTPHSDIKVIPITPLPLHYHTPFMPHFHPCLKVRQISHTIPDIQILCIDIIALQCLRSKQLPCMHWDQCWQVRLCVSLLPPSKEAISMWHMIKVYRSAR